MGGGWGSDDGHGVGCLGRFTRKDGCWFWESFFGRVWVIGLDLFAWCFLGIGLIPVFRTLNDVVNYESIFSNFYFDAIGTLSCCR